MAVDSSDNVYVADTSNNRIQKFDSKGNFLSMWGDFGTGDGQFRFPVAVAVGDSDNVYVADSSNYRIQKFDSDGTFITKWGSQGSDDGQFGKQPNVGRVVGAPVRPEESAASLVVSAASCGTRGTS